MDSFVFASQGNQTRRTGLIRILRYNAVTRERLLRAPLQAGRVHSVFERAVNLEWHDDGLITLHGPGPLAAPFAVAVAPPSEIAGLTRGTPVRRHENCLFFGGLALEAEGAALASTMICGTDGPPGPLASWLAGFALPPVGPGLSSPAGESARRQIAESILSRDAQAFVGGAYGLIGLGEGLTPAGDDCLVGVLAALHRFAHSWLWPNQEIKNPVTAAARARTTAVGRDFILYALDGEFSEPVVRLITATSTDEARSAVALLMERGATSGADLLCGINLALQAVKERCRIADQGA